MFICLGRRVHVKTYEPIQGKLFDTIDDYNEFIRSTEGLVYVNTMTLNDKLLLLYTIAKENK